MFPDLTDMERPIAIYPEYVVNQRTVFHVEQHGKGWSSGKYTISKPNQRPLEPDSSQSEKILPNDALCGRALLMYVDGKFGSLDAKRSFCDASGLPLFELYRKIGRPTWYVELHGSSDTAIARLDPQIGLFKDKLEVSIMNVGARGGETMLHVQGQDIWKQRTNVYFGDKIIMTAKRTDKWSVYIPGKKLQWVMDIAAGMDMALASVIVVVLAANMYDSSMQSSGSS